MDQLQIQSLLEGLLGSTNVYFQPPAGVQMKYPAIVYERDAAVTRFADNAPYRYTKRYSVKHIGMDPNSPVPDKLAHLPMSLFERHFTAGNLHHDIFNIYF